MIEGGRETDAVGVYCMKTGRKCVYRMDLVSLLWQ